MFQNARLYTAAAMVAASASLAGAQASTSLVKPFSFGISGGAAIPMSDLSNGSSNGFTGVNTGYNVTGSVALGFPVIPFSVRADVAYNSFGTKNVQVAANANSASYNADARVVGVTANAVLPIPLPVPILSPYLIGGVGAYNVRLTPFAGAANSSQTNRGFNLGAGVTLPLPGLNTFVEARYHRVNMNNGSMAFVPITVGVMF